MNIYNINTVKQYFTDNECELLEDKYINAKTKMKYICSCGNISEITFGKFKYRKQRCMKCSGTPKHSQKYVEQYFNSEGCQLLDNYKSNKQKLKYRCHCGNISEIKFNNFIQGQKCIKCFYTRISGKNSHFWNDDRKSSEINKKIQDLSSPHKKKFRKKYNISKEFEIDHIFPVKAFVDYKIYDLELINLEENLQPLLPNINRKKSSKYNKIKFEKYLRSKDYKIYTVKEIE